MDNYNEDRDKNLHLDNDNYDEETAAEVMPLPNQALVRDRDRDDIDVDRADSDAGRGWGIFGIILSIASLFFLPVLLGAAGIIVGFVARARGAKGFGNWAIGLGIVSIIVSLIFAPFF